MEHVVNKYFLFFESLGKINIISKKNIQRFLMLIYFPIIISALIYTNTNTITSILIIFMVILSPILILPAIYYKTFLLYRNLNLFKFDFISDDNFSTNNIEFSPVPSKIFVLKSFNSNLIHYDPKKYIKIEKVKDFYNEYTNKHLDVTDYNLINHKPKKYIKNKVFYNKNTNKYCDVIDHNLIHYKPKKYIKIEKYNEDIDKNSHVTDSNLIHYNPKKLKTFKKIKKLQDFYNKNANKYFDIIDYNSDYFTNLIYSSKSLNTSKLIHLDSKISSLEIKILLIELNKITGIYQSELAKIFYTNSNRSINIKSINSTYSQFNRILKS